jgi:hypothetical protein
MSVMKELDTANDGEVSFEEFKVLIVAVLQHILASDIS